MMVCALSCVLVFLQTSGSIEGTVINSVSNKPVARAVIQATKLPSTASGTAPAPAGGFIIAGAIGGIVSQAGGPQQPAAATSDASGHFAFQGLEPGTYLLRASAEGYARQDFGGSNATTMQKTVTLAAGAAIKDVAFRLIPGGTVSGRITGSDGEALVNIEAAVFRAAYDGDGRKTLQQVSAAQSNDRGEYRLFWLAPGRYYLSVAPSNRPLAGVPFFPGMTTNKYPRTFYPGTTDVASATPIDIQPAAELNSMDFRLTEQPTYRVRGRILGADGRPPGPGVAIGITPRESSILGGGISFSGSPYNPADGTFEIRDVASGVYIIRAQLPMNFRPEPGTRPPVPIIALAPVDVRGGDVDGVFIRFESPISITGRVAIEGEAAPETFRPGITLRPAEIGPNEAPIRGPEWNADGTFKLDGILPGEYRVQAFGGVPGSLQPLYVKQIRFGSVDVLTKPFVISGSTADMLDIVFAKGGGKITGIVRAESQQVVDGTMIVLVPDQRERRDLYRMTRSDSSGRFTFPPVPPGSYQAFAWQQIEPNSWLDPAVLGPYENRGARANVSGSSDVSLELKLIPPPDVR